MTFLPRVRFAMLATSLALSGCVVPLDTLGQMTGQLTGQPTPAPVTVAPTGVPPLVSPPGLSSTQSTVELALNEERLLGSLLKDNAGREPAVGAVLWQSTNPQVVSIHPATGQAKGVAPGTTVIVATLVGSNARTQFEVKVVDKFTVRAITVDPPNPVLAIGEKQALRATVAMADGTVSANVNWSSSDSTVATVNPTNGEVSALKEGRVTIEATYALDTQFKGVANVTIVKNKGDAPTAPQPSTVVFGPDVTPGTATGPVGVPGRFVIQLSGTTNDLSAVDFIDAKTGFAAGTNGILLRTTTGGAGWEDISSGSLSGQEIRSIHFKDVTTGLALTRQGLFQTADGGATWTPVDLGHPGSFSRMAFHDDMIGYLFTADGGVGLYFRTTDGGATWAKVSFPASSFVNDVARVGGADVILADTGAYLYDAALGGYDKRQATSSYADNQGARSASIAAAGNRVWIIGNEDFSSADGGRSWATLGQPKGADGKPLGAGGGARDVVAFASGEVFAVTSSGIRTSQDGEFWAYAPDVVATGRGLSDADFIDPYTGWVVGGSGTIIRYSAR